MSNIKIIIQVRDASIEAVYSNTPIDYVLVDYDCLENEESPVQAPRQADLVKGEFYALYDTGKTEDKGVKDELQRIQF